LFEPPDDVDLIGPDDDEHPRLLTGSAGRWLTRATVLLRELAGRRRGWIAAGGVALAAVAGATVVLSLAAPVAPQDTPARASPTPARAAPLVVITSAMMNEVGSDGVFAWGTSGGHRWQLAVQDIADPGYRCRPGVTVNGSDAAPLFPAGRMSTPVGNAAFVTLGPAIPGTGFAFIQLPADVSWLWFDPDAGPDQPPAGLQPVTVIRCGITFRLAGFAYPLTARLRLHTGSASWTVPSSYSDPVGMLQFPQVSGIWMNTGPATRQAPAQIGTGTAMGLPWSVVLVPGTSGDCFGLDTGLLGDSAQQGTSVRTYCAPISTPAGLDAIVTFALGFPAAGSQGCVYALSVASATASVELKLDSGPDQRIRLTVAGGRKYAAFFVAPPSVLVKLELLDTRGRVIGWTDAIPAYGYLQFRP
jgi:hypothetical protein